MGTLTRAQKSQLLVEGFLPSEIRDLNDARAPDGTLQDFAFNAKPVRAARQSRQEWIRYVKKIGWTEAEAKQRIASYFRLKGRRSIFDFIKLEYSPTRKLTDFQDAVRRKIRSRVSRTFGRAYGRGLRPSLRPKYLPRRDLYPPRPRPLRRRR